MHDSPSQNPQPQSASSHVSTNQLGQYQCPGCEYIYDEAKGDAHEGIAPSTAFQSLSEDFTCPDCSVRYKEDFVLLR